MRDHTRYVKGGCWIWNENSVVELKLSMFSPYWLWKHVSRGGSAETCMVASNLGYNKSWDSITTDILYSLLCLQVGRWFLWFDARHVEVSVGICGVESANVRIASLNPDHPSNMELDHKPVPKLRDDGWFELELGNFLTEREDDCIELRMEDVKPGCQPKRGLIILLKDLR